MGTVVHGLNAKKYAHVVNGVVVRVFKWDENEAPERYPDRAGFVQVPLETPVGKGWVYDGASFTDPNAPPETPFDIEKARIVYAERINDEFLKLSQGLFATPEIVDDVKAQALAAIAEINVETDEEAMRVAALDANASVKEARLTAATLVIDAEVAKKALMAYNALPLDVLPGLFKEASDYASQGRYVDGDNVRFWKGFPERIGGWSALTTTEFLLRPARGVNAWRSLSGTQLMAFGHARGVQLFNSGSLYDIAAEGTNGVRTLTVTPVVLSGVSVSFTFASPTVCSWASHGLVAGSGVVFAGGSLPAAVVAGTTYYVSSSGLAAGTFKISDTSAHGVAGTNHINTAGTGSGTGATSFSFSTDETVTTANGATGKLYAAATTTPIYVTQDGGTISVAMSGMSGTFLVGERVSFSGGGTGIVITGGSSSPIYIDHEDSTLTGTLTGGISGATGTVTSTTTLWSGLISGGTSNSGATISTYAEYGKVNSGATFGWGEGGFGEGVWGGSESIFSNVTDCTTWTFANWGEDIIGNPRAGKIYILDTSAWISSSATNMTLMSTNAPSTSLGIFLNDANRTLISYGAHDGSVDDPLNIRWCDEEDYTDWTATASNTAGSLRCQIGSTIVGVSSCRGGYLISTDRAIYSFRYIGLPYVFSLTVLAENVSFIGPHAGVQIDGITYWMGTDGFYSYDGAVSPLPCDVHRDVFSNLNIVQAHKVYCQSVRAYNEVWWFYSTNDATDEEVDKFVAYNTVERTWFQGSLEGSGRSCFLDSSVVLAHPVGADPDTGHIFAHEYGTTANGSEFDYSLETSELEVSDGTTFLHNRMLIPDFERITGDHTVTVELRGYPQRGVRTKGPFTVNSSTEKVSTRARGRMMKMIFEGSNDFRMGRWRYKVTGHGGKGG